MIHLLTSAVFLLGTLFHVMIKVTGYKKDFPTLSPGAVWSTFFKEEWDSLIVSAITLGVLQASIYIINYQQIPIPDWMNWGIYVIAILLGYQGQRLAYKYLNTAAGVLEKKADDLANKISDK